MRTEYSRASRRPLVTAIFAISCAIVLTAHGNVSAQAAGTMRNITTMELVRNMGLGINIGNTFEATIVCEDGDQGCVDWVGGMETLETSWGSPTITDAIIKGYANAGFKTIRLPVAWSNKMTGDSRGGTYTISPALMNRVNEVVDMILANGMYVILNIHWDGGWWENFPADSAECMKKYARIWEQVGERFKNYSDYLMFESLNEEGVWDDVWYVWRNEEDIAAKTRAYGLLSAINQRFTDIVRASGGNNAERHLLIAGYATNIDRTIDPMFRMPSDPKNRCAVSVHYYDPFGFTHLSQDESWASLQMTWGSVADYDQLNTEMDKMKEHFVEKGIPVIIGEYGYANWNPKLEKPRADVRRYTLEVANAALSRNLCPVLWDVQLKPDEGEIVYYYNRNTASFVDAELVTGFKELAAKVGSGPSAINKRTASAKIAGASVRINISARGKMLNVQSSTNSDISVRMIDVKGKVVAKFNAPSGRGNFSIDKIPAGRYIVETRGVGFKKVSGITVTSLNKRF